jgi:hypothetical protein
MFFGKPPSKFLEVYLNSEYLWKWSPVYNFNSARALKKLISAGVEVTSTLPISDTQKDLLICKCFHSAMPNFDIVLLNEQNCCKSKHDV